MTKFFELELQDWMTNNLSPYCLNKCEHSCCDCEGHLEISPKYIHLFETYKLTGKKVPLKSKNFNGPHLHKSGNMWFFEGGACPNFDAKNKLCLIHNKYPRCSFFPLLKTKHGYMLFSTCELHYMNVEKEPLKSLLVIFKKHGESLYLE